jgi:septal ring factor EnvC (AmiA/AmiB activator)
MRKFLIPIVAAASTLAIAAPAAAQYNYGRGWNYHQYAQSMEQRVQRIRADIRQLQQRHIVSWQEARSLENQAADIQRRIYRKSRNGIQPGEARQLENQIRNLEFRVSREARDWNNRPNRRRY